MVGRLKCRSRAARQSSARSFNDLEFLLPGTPTQDVSNEVEVALTLGVRKPVDFLGVSFDRIGLGYRQGSDGLKGVRLVASFPF